MLLSFSPENHCNTSVEIWVVSVLTPVKVSVCKESKDCDCVSVTGTALKLLFFCIIALLEMNIVTVFRCGVDQREIHISEHYVDL